jgi:hypothetical protein
LTESLVFAKDLSGNQVKNGFARYQAGAESWGAFTKDKPLLL